jgi:predicted XRE-type DNA-binding protein
MKAKVNKWIQKTHLKKGALSRQLGVPVAKDIPVTLLKKIQSAEKGSVVTNPAKLGKKKVTVTGLLKRRTNLAMNLKNIKRRY